MRVPADVIQFSIDHIEVLSLASARRAGRQRPHFKALGVLAMSRLNRLVRKCLAKISSSRQKFESLAWRAHRVVEPMDVDAKRRSEIAKRLKDKVIDVGTCAMEDICQQGWFNKATQEILPGFAIHEDDTVVDVGCGEGGMSSYAALFGADVIATDIDPTKIELLNRKLPVQGQTARSFKTIVSDSDPLPIADGTASKVISMEVLEHVDDPAKFMAELVRIGKVGALYLISVPDPVGEALQRVAAHPCYWERPNHLRVFEHKDLDQLIENAGLKIEIRTRTGFFWTMWWMLFWGAKQEFGAPQDPILEHWTKAWYGMVLSPTGAAARRALDDFMPKSQVVIARKVA
jgi:2-polyprenyl-3-methyl-5-hydroxy-6-metoxy-1,4-benzoquinol methylase